MFEESNPIKEYSSGNNPNKQTNVALEFIQSSIVFPSYRNGLRQLVASGCGFMAAAESEGKSLPDITHDYRISKAQVVSLECKPGGHILSRLEKRRQIGRRKM